ncbi:MAG TPA: hypothetical protein VIE17_09300 [Methylophilaceae bacterium]|jgi:hypothetical protein
MKTLLFFFGLCFATATLAQTCVYGKVDGSVMIANVPLQSTKNRPQGQCFGIAEPDPVKTTKSVKNTPTPTDFPKVDAATQQQRDGTRRQILQDELNSEHTALEDAQKSNKTPDITLHQQNINMLEKELSSLK